MIHIRNSVCHIWWAWLCDPQYPWPRHAFGSNDADLAFSGDCRAIIAPMLPFLLNRSSESHVRCCQLSGLWPSGKARATARTTHFVQYLYFMWLWFSLVSKWRCHRKRFTFGNWAGFEILLLPLIWLIWNLVLNLYQRYLNSVDWPVHRTVSPQKLLKNTIRH